jgi:glycosyltransferase involved in cell wall biosynthesis
MVNMNHFQRVYFLSRQARLTVFARRRSDFSSSAAEGTEIVNAPFQSKLGVILACLLWMIGRGRSRAYDVVLTEPSKLCICGLFGKVLLGAKWVVDVWDIPFRCQSRLLWRRCMCRVSRVIGRGIFRFADLFILSILPNLEFAEYGISDDKIVLLRNAIWLDAQNAGRGNVRPTHDSEFQVLCARSCFTEDSGLDVLAEAFDRLRKSCVNVRLVIIGRIPRAVERQVEGLRHRGDVCFREFVEHAELLALMAASDVGVIPFRNTMDLAQTYPIKALEYLSQGMVTIAADLAGVASIIKHGHNGLLFEPGNPADLAEKMRRACEEPVLAARLSSRGTDLESEYDCRRKARRILQALNDLVSGRHGSALKTIRYVDRETVDA